MVAWEVAIGRIKSSCDITRDTYGTSVWMYSQLRRLARTGLTPQFINEMKLELVRLKVNPSAVSRLTGVYFFENESDAYTALDRWNIPGKKKYISQVNFSANNITRVDSEWITSYMRSTDEQEWMVSYWSGEVQGVKPLTEVLASGIGMVGNNALRQEATRRIYEQHLTSSPLLSMACCGYAYAGFADIAIVKPWIWSEGGALHGSHIIDVQDLSLHEDVLLEAMEFCRKRGEILPMVVPDDSESFFRTPDISHLDFKLESVVATDLFNSVHDLGFKAASS
ncbi:hypothetical protein D3C87_224250 [compost metagenome]